MHKYILKAVVDTREQKFVQKTIAFFRTKNIEVESKALHDYGDVAIFLTTKKWCNIERKSIVDPCIIVYGTIQDLKRVSSQYAALKRIKQTSIDKMRRTIEMVYKTPVFFVEKESHYFLEIMNIAEVLCKKDDDILNKPSVSVKNRPDVNLIMQANRIGEKTALLLLKEFGTPEKVLNASREDLLKIKGVGDSTIADLKTLKKIYYKGI